MPRVKYIGARNVKKSAQLGALLMGKKQYMALTFSEIGEKIGVCKDTVSTEFRNPERIPLGRLGLYAKALDLPKEDVIAAFPW